MTETKKTNNAAQVARFADMFAQHPMQDLVADAQGELGMMTVNGQAFPYTVSDQTKAATCYLCSPATAYIDYALAEADAVVMSPAAKALTRATIKAFAPLVRATGLDRQVQLNNWMVSTNPAPDIGGWLAQALKETCMQTHPDRAIVVRSLNDAWDGHAIAAFRAAGFRLLAARQIYVLPHAPQKPSRDAKRDAKLLADTSFEIVQGPALSVSDFDACAALYRALYLEKYTTLNPHYTATFFHDLQSRGVMQFVALRDASGGIVGFSGLFESANTLTQPFVGYDTARPQSEGLYRMLMQIGRAYAQTRGLNYNMSAGASAFKRNRGAVTAIEYTAVYVAHRPWKMRAATAILEWASCAIGLPLVKRFET